MSIFCLGREVAESKKPISNPLKYPTLAHSSLPSIQNTVPCLGDFFQIYLKSNSKFVIIPLY